MSEPVPNRAKDPKRQSGVYTNDQGQSVLNIDGILSPAKTEGMDTVTVTAGKKKKPRGSKYATAYKPDPETSMHEIQLKHGDKNWATEYSYQGRGIEAMNHYKGINVGNGYSKRFLVDGRTVHTTTS